MGIFKKRKKTKLETLPRMNIGNIDAVKRMSELRKVIEIAEQTGKYLVCISIHDPNKKLDRTKVGKDGNLMDIHHFTFAEDFKEDDRYGCLDKYAELLKLGDK